MAATYPLSGTQSIAAAVAAEAAHLPARRRLTAQAATRLDRRVVTRLVNERVSFDQLASLTDRARLRDQVIADLARSRSERVRDARSRARSGRRWSW
jgi:hypothetical protein